MFDGHLVTNDQCSTHPILPVLPLLERLIIRSFFELHCTDYLTALRLYAPFLVSISSMRPISLCIHLIFDIRARPVLDWSEVAALLLLPVFRHPVRICLSAHLLSTFVSSLRGNSDLERLHETGKLVIQTWKDFSAHNIRWRLGPFPIF
jgi:hypothetical protein